MTKRTTTSSLSTAISTPSSSSSGSSGSKGMVDNHHLVHVADATTNVATNVSTSSSTSNDVADDDDSSSASAAAAALWVTYINIVLYALCFQLQRPVEPFLIQSLSEQQQQQQGDGTTTSITQTYGNLQSFFSAIQTIGSPLVGILLDRIGIRYASAIVFFASAMSYGILASATSMKWLFWSKVPTALQHAFLVAQATAATSTGNNIPARAAALGRMTTAYTIGATIGPAVGGYLAGQGDLYIGAKVAVIGSLLSVILSLAVLPNGNGSTTTSTKSQINHNNNNNDESDIISSTESSSSSSSSSSSKMIQQLKIKKRSFLEEIRHSVGDIALRSTLWPLLVVKVLGGVSASMHSSTVPLVAVQLLEFNPSQLGLSTSIVMFSVAAFGAIGMAPLTQWLGPSGMAHWGLVLRAICGWIMATLVSYYYVYQNNQSLYLSNHTTIFIQVVCVSVLHGLASHTLATGLTTQTTGAVQSDEQGALLGLEHGLFALARIVGPWLGTMLLQQGGGGGGITSLWPVESACGGLDLLLVASLIAATTTTSWSNMKMTMGGTNNNNPKRKDY